MTEQLGSDAVQDQEKTAVIESPHSVRSAATTVTQGKAFVSAGALQKGSQVGQYRIVRELGRGGQGKVFLAEDTKLGRLVALKTVTHAAISEGSLKRFHNEARAVANVHHQSIVQLFEVFEYDGLPFLSMEFVDGDTLLNLCKNKALERRQIIEILTRCCQAIGTAHHKGLVHRDLKPQNIMIARGGDVKVMDFGLAKSVLGDSGYTMATLDGQIIGSPAYMSPEQAAGQPVSVQSDVFALGTVLYQCLSGKLPHAADTPVETIFRVMHEEPIPLHHLDPSIAGDLSAIVMKALEKSPPRRYADAAELAEDLQRYLRNEDVVARPATMRDHVVKALRRNSDIAVISGVALTVVALTITFSMWLFARQSVAQVGEGLKTELKSVANTAAMMFEVEDVNVEELKADPAAFKDLVLQLNEIRRRNPRVENVYLLGPGRTDESLIYIADADAFLPHPVVARQTGSDWMLVDGSSAWKAFSGALADTFPVSPGKQNRWSGCAPVLDADGRAVALLAIEMGAEALSAGMRPAVRTTVQVGGLGALLFCGFTGFAGIRVMRHKLRRKAG